MTRSESTLCPDRAQLQQLLSGQSSDPEFSKLEAHLLQCDQCSLQADALIPSAEVTAMLSRAETQVFRTREAEQVEQLIRKIRTLRSAASANVEQTLIGAGDARVDRVPQETLLNAGQTVAVDASTVSFLRPAQQPDEIGRLGAYRILQVLGSGGMGVVYRAEDPSLKRLVALKVMKPTVAATGSAKERFLREAQFTAAIEHDHIVQIYQVGEDNGVPFIAMPLLRGESLKSRLEKTGRMPQSDVVRIGKEVAAGLAAAHERGLIHRDIKPDNIWIEEKTGRVRILDFGLVRSVSDDTELTQSGMVLGTPKYMAPEQAQGLAVDHRSDLFSLGSVLYHLATGKPAFDGNNLTATLMAVVHQDPQPIEALSPEIHPKLATLIAELVQKDRVKRPQSAGDVSQRMAEIEQSLKNPSRGDTSGNLPNGGVPVVVPNVNPMIADVSIVTQPVLRRAPPRPPRGKMLALAAGGGGLLLMLGILIITIRDKDGKETTLRVPSGIVADIDVQPGTRMTIREDASEASGGGAPAGMKSAEGAREATKTADRALRFSEKGHYAEIPAFTQWGDAPMTLEAVVRFNSDAPGQFLVLDGWIIMTNDAREDTGVLSQLVLNEQNHILQGHPAATEIGLTCHIAIVRTATTFDLYINGVKATDPPGQVTWSTAEFKALEQGKLPELKLQSAVGGTLIGNFKDWASRCDVTFSEIRVSNTARYQADFKPRYRYEPDERTLALYHFDEGEGTVLNDASGNEHHGTIVGGTWVNDGIISDMELMTRSRINVEKEASFVPPNKPKLWPVGPLPAWASEEPRWSIMRESFTIPGVVERPTEFKEIGRWNVDTVQARGAINVARFSPDGKWLATGSTDGHVRVYDVATMKLRRLLPGLGGQQGAIDLSWHPDSQRIAVAADNAFQLRIWTIDGQLLREELAGSETYNTINSVAWTFDGSRLICGGANRLDVRDSDGTKIKALVSGQDGPYCNPGSIAVSPDRQRFIVWQFDGARIWNAETFEIEATIPIQCSNSTNGHRVRWSSKDRISLSTFEQLTICNAVGTVLKEFPTESLCAAAWRPDGENLTTWRWDLNDLNTNSGESLPPDQRLIVGSGGAGTIPTAIDWSPDGKRLALAGGRLVICKDGVSQIEYDSEIRSMPVSSVSLNPDGSQIVSVSQISDDCVRLWSSDGAAQSTMLLNEMMLATPRVAWSPDGGNVAVAWPQSSHFRIGKPNNDFLTIAGSCATLAWNPDGTQLAAGLTNGHILITDTAGKILHDLDTGEMGGVNVGWSKRGTLVAHAGQKILRVDPSSSETKISLIADVQTGPSDTVAVWRPDGNEISLGYDMHVSVGDVAPERIRRASPSAAWAPDGSKCLFPMGPFTALLRPDGSNLLSRTTNASTTMLNGAWSPAGETVYVGYDQSLLVARNADDLHVKWSAVLLPNRKSATFHVGGSVLDGDRETLERDFAYYAADEKGNVRLLSASEFELQTGEEILPGPGRHFDSDYRFAISIGDNWKPAPLESVTVPGIARAAFSKAGGVSLSLFIQETGDLVDAAWMLAESTRAQEEKFSATVLEKEVRKVAGQDAMWMIVEGKGNGSAIDGKGPVNTRQHWIAIPRSKDVFVAMLTSPSGTFASNQALFLKAIETLKLREMATTP